GGLRRSRRARAARRGLCAAAAVGVMRGAFAGRRGCVAIAALLLLVAGDAAARKFQMSGNWVMRNGQVFLPLQFAKTAGGILGIPSMSVTPAPKMHISMGNLTGAFHFPNTVIPGGGVVTASGSAPATLRIPRHRFVEDAMTLFPLNGITLAQITTNFGIDGPFSAATLAPGGGPGSFTWCVGDPACVARPPPAHLMTDHPVGMGSMARNGRVIYRRGANQFGGAMQMGLRRGGVESNIRPNANPIQIQHVRFGGSGTTLRRVAVGGLGAADDPAKEMVYLSPNFITQPTMYTPPGPIL